MSNPAIDRAQSRFFVALLPPEDIQNYAYHVIRELSDRYRTRTSNAPPHITLQPPFLWQLEATSALENSLSTFAHHQSKIPVVLSGFGAFKPRVLFINVLKTSELLQLQTNLMTQLEAQLGIVDPVAQRRPFAPHMTVASRNLTRQTFQQAWSDLQHRSIEFQFVVDRLTLLIHDGRCWQVQADFCFAA